MVCGGVWCGVVVCCGVVVVFTLSLPPDHHHHNWVRILYVPVCDEALTPRLFFLDVCTVVFWICYS